MIGALLAGLAAGYGIAIPVGAVSVLIVETGLRSGFRSAAAAGAGTATADAVYATIAAVFGTALAAALIPWQAPLRAAAVVVLVGLALRGFRSVARDAERARDGGSGSAPSPGPESAHSPRGVPGPGSAHSPRVLPGPASVRPPSGPPAAPIGPGPGGPQPRSARRTYAAFLGLTLLNPMTITYFAALIVGLGGTGTAPIEKLAFVVAAFGASLSWQTLIAAAGAALHRRLGPRLRLSVGVTGNAIVLAFAAVIAAGLAR
jgi:threonine/homoserine/homoserine lactone efflux protein